MKETLLHQSDAAKCPIGVFDSGYGGLTILKEIVKELPEYDYIYLGDNARTPYGTRSCEVVYEYTLEAVRRLFGLGCRLVILACNTASAKALRTIQQRDLPVIDSRRRVLGVIRPSVEALAAYTRNGHVGILATRGTVASCSYPLEIEKLYGGTHWQITQVACPLWVPLVENGELAGEGTDYFIQKYIDELWKRDSEVDTVILGCTHYPLLRERIAAYMPAYVRIIEQGPIVARSLRNYLLRHPEMEREISRGKEIRYFTTEKPELFGRMAGVFLGREIVAEHLDILDR